MNVLFSSISEAGPTREENQDFTLIDHELGLFLVCDGMGGAEGGAIASKLAAETIYGYLQHHQDQIQSAQSSRQLRFLLIEAVEAAAKVIYGRAVKEEALTGMGTTATALLIVGNLAVMAHVGDSRLYLLRQSILRLLSTDHRLVEELVEQGAMTPEQAETSPYRHVLSRALGPQPAVTVDTMSFELLPKDKIVICSDGILELFESESDLARSITAQKPEDFINGLPSIANRVSCSDNYSLILLDVLEGDAESQRRTDETLVKLSSLQSLYLFRSLEQKSLIRLVERSFVVSANTDEVLITEGEEGDSLFIILDGDVSVQLAGKQLSTLSKGNHFGEMSMLSGVERSATIVATAPTKVLKLERQAIDDICREDLRAGIEIYKALSRELSIRLRDSNRRLSKLGEAAKG